MVGAKIKQYLEDNGITQSFICKKTGFTPRKMCAICSGKQVLTCIDYYKICKALNLSLDFFMEGEE